MFRRSILIAVALLFSASVAHADPIEGNWLTQSGETAAIGDCGGGFCIKLLTGKYKGRGIGKISAQGDGEYAGSITDPATDKTYNGKASISGSSMKMKGCVLGGLLCKIQSWTKM